MKDRSSPLSMRPKRNSASSTQLLPMPASVPAGARPMYAYQVLRQVLDTNLLGAYLVAREGARRLLASGSREGGNGRIVLIGSITALQNGTGDAMNAATKAGLAHLGRQFARDWVRQGINVNTLQPGWIPTEINKRMICQRSWESRRCKVASPSATQQQCTGRHAVVSAVGSFRAGYGCDLHHR